MKLEIKTEYYSIPCTHQPEVDCSCDMQKRMYFELPDELFNDIVKEIEGT